MAEGPTTCMPGKLHSLSACPPKDRAHSQMTLKDGQLASRRHYKEIKKEVTVPADPEMATKGRSTVLSGKFLKWDRFPPL